MHLLKLLPRSTHISQVDTSYRTYPKPCTMGPSKINRLELWSILIICPWTYLATDQSNKFHSTEGPYKLFMEGTLHTQCTEIINRATFDTNYE